MIMIMIVIVFAASLLQKASGGFYFEDCSRSNLFWASPACYKDFYDLRLRRDVLIIFLATKGRHVSVDVVSLVTNLLQYLVKLANMTA